MNTLQKQILKNYRTIFPKDTFKIISSKTGIQITRVFRIFNGAPMKLSEYEVFDRLIYTQANFSDINFKNLTRRCSKELNTALFKDLVGQMKYLLLINSKLGR